MTHTHLIAPVGNTGADWAIATPVAGPVSMRQAAILRYVTEYTDVHGYPPSLRDIAAAVGLSPNSMGAVDYQVRELERLGLLARPERRGQRRSLRLILGGAA